MNDRTPEDSESSEPEGSEQERADSAALGLLSTVLRYTLPVVVVAIGLAVLMIARANAPEPSQTARDRAALVVSTMDAVAVSAPRVWEGYGVARAMDSADLSAQVAGRVASIGEGIEEGTPVEAGEVICRIEAVDYEQRLIGARQLVRATEAQIEEINARETQLRRQMELVDEEVSIASSELDRVRGAADRGAATDTDVDIRLSALRRSERTRAGVEEQLSVLPAQRQRLEATLTDNRSAVRIAEENLSRTEIASPVSGFVQRLDVEQSELLSVGSPVARVVNIDRLEIPVRVAVAAAESLAVGDPVDLRADNGSDERWRGVIARIAPEAEPASRTFTVFVEVNQNSAEAIGTRSPQTSDGLLLLPGQFVVGRIQTASAGERIVVPRRALTGDRVLVAENGGSAKRATRREVVVSHFYDGPIPEAHPTETQWAVLTSGLGPGETVIVSNLGQLEPGMVIETRSVFAASGVARLGVTGADGVAE